jgi:hypothetical protein
MEKSIPEDKFSICLLLSLEEEIFEAGSGDAYTIMDNSV